MYIYRMYLSIFPQAMTRDGEEGESPPLRVHVMETPAGIKNGRRAASLGLWSGTSGWRENKEKNREETAFFVVFCHILFLTG